MLANYQCNVQKVIYFHHAHATLVERIQIAGVIIEKDGKILMHRRSYEPGKGKLNFIGGYIDEGETAEQTAVREAKEETGFDVEIVAKLGEFGYFEREEKTIHIFIAKIIGGRMTHPIEGKPMWVDLDELNPERDMSFPQMFQIFEAYGKCEVG